MMSLRVRLNRLVLALTLISTAVSTASAEPPCDPAWNARFGGHHDLAGVANDAVLFDGPRGPEIVVGGVFHGAGSVAVNNIARWNGRSWQDLLGGVRTIDGTTATVRALLAMPPQTSARRHQTLVVGGSFHRAGDVAASNIASWDGASWASLAGGLNGAVAALTRWTDEGGDVVVAGGAFDVAGEISAPHVAQWDGESWQSLGSGIAFEVTALGVSPVADGNELFAACAPGSPVLRWNGSAWVEASQGLPPSPFMSVRAFARANLGDGDFLYAAIDSNDGLLYRWQRDVWTPVGGDGASHPSGYAISLDEITVGGAPALAVSGDAFSFPDGRSSTALTWDGRSWAPLPADDGLGSCGGFIEARLGDATGDDLYALAAGTVQRPFGSMARYDGAMWQALSPGNSGVVHALLDWTAPHGETLMIAGGWLSALGGEGVRCIAAWNGREWTSLGGTSGSVEVLAVHDDGTGRGTRLYAGGEFGIERPRNQESLVAWDGHRGEVVPEIEGVVGALATFDDGSGRPCMLVAASTMSATLPSTGSVAGMVRGRAPARRRSAMSRRCVFGTTEADLPCMSAR